MSVDTIRMVPSRDRRRERHWIKENRAEYAGQWIVVDGDRLIAANVDGHKAFAAGMGEHCPIRKEA